MNHDSRWHVWDSSALFLREPADVPRYVPDPEVYAALDTSALPAGEPVALPPGTSLSPPIRSALGLAEEVALSTGGPEFRTALRRMVSRVASTAPALLTQTPSPLLADLPERTPATGAGRGAPMGEGPPPGADEERRTTAAALIAAIGSINGVMDVSDPAPSRVLAPLAVDEPAARALAARVLRVLGWTVLEDVPYILLHPDLTVSWVRRVMLEDPDEDMDDEWWEEDCDEDECVCGEAWLDGRAALGLRPGSLPPGCILQTLLSRPG